MFQFPETEKKLKSRISSYRSAMRKEKKEYGSINDGSGKRYSLFGLYLVLDDIEKSQEYLSWYCEEFSNDVGEPFQKLCWAIVLFRAEKYAEAKIKLAETMLSNLYLIPDLISLPKQNEYDMWHSSNLEALSYISYLPVEIRCNIKESELSWIRKEYDSLDSRRVRKKYISIYNQMQTANDIEKRKALLKESASLLGTLKFS